MDGNLIARDTEEGKRQLSRGEHPETKDAGASTATDSQVTANDDDEEGGAKAKSGKEKKLTNQFNFSERASQTYNNPLRERGTMTEPPPRLTYASNITQWEIYDAYVEDYEQNVINMACLYFYCA